MVESTEPRKRNDVSGLGRLDVAPSGRVALERHVGTIVIVVAQILAEASQQVKLIEDDEVIDNFATQVPTSRST